MINANIKTSEFTAEVPYRNEEIAVFNSLKSALPRNVLNIEVECMALCTSGEASIVLNGQRMTIKKDSMFVCHQNAMLGDVVKSEDFDCRGVFMKVKYLHRLLPLTENSLDMKFYFDKNPILPLNADEARTALQYHLFLNERIEALRGTAQMGRVVDALMAAFLLEFGLMIKKHANIPVHQYTASESYYRDFIKMLDHRRVKERNVAYYAKRLGITSKYLNTVCRRTGDHTASDLIDQYICRDIVHLLTHTNKQVKDIAYELKFKSTSYFGKYVKSQFGMSPRMVREQAINGGSVQEKNRVNNSSNI